MALALLPGLFLILPAFGATEPPATEAAKKIATLEEQRGTVDKNLQAAAAYLSRQVALVTALDGATQGLGQILLQFSAIGSADGLQELFASRWDPKLADHLRAAGEETGRLPLAQLPDTVRGSAGEAGRLAKEALTLAARIRENLSLSPQSLEQMLRREQPGLLEAAGPGDQANFILLQYRTRLMRSDLEGLDGVLKRLRKNLAALSAGLETASAGLKTEARRLKQELDYRRYSGPQ